MNDQIKPSRGRKRRVVHPTEIVESCESALSKTQFAVLMAASGCAGDYGGIAATLNIPLGTVRSRLNRARNAIEAVLATREALEKAGGSDVDHAL